MEPSEDDVRHVPAARAGEVRRALRDPGRPRRAGPRARGAGHRLPGRASTAGGNPEIFGEGSGAPDPDRGRELPDAQGPADLRHAGRPAETRAAGSTSSTGTARASPTGLFPAKDRRAQDRAAPPEARPSASRRSTSPADASPLTRRRAATGLAGVLAPAGLPDREPARPARDRRRRAAALPADLANPLRRFVGHLRTSTLRALQERVRRHLRPHRRRAQPLPDLLRATATPASAGVALLQFKQTYLPARVSSSTDGRSCPTTSAWCCEFGRDGRPRRGLAAAARPPRRTGDAAAGAGRRRDSPWAGAVEAVCARPCRPLRGDEHGRRTPAGRAEGPPAEEVGLDALRRVDPTRTIRRGRPPAGRSADETPSCG